MSSRPHASPRRVQSHRVQSPGSRAAPEQHRPPQPGARPPAPTVEPLPWQRLDTRMLLVNPVQELMRFLPFVIGAFVLGSNSDRSWWQLLGVAIPVGARGDPLPDHPLPDHPDAGRAPARAAQQEGADRAARPGARRRAHLLADPPDPGTGQGRDRDGERGPGRAPRSSSSIRCRSSRPVTCGSRCCTGPSLPRRTRTRRRRRRPGRWRTSSCSASTAGGCATRR